MCSASALQIRGLVGRDSHM
uniref:Uncharacterized protein n=1 Tax=Anguilla anguilla TaxID=7936 RepID=A0A0E9REB6_ANGAN